MGKKSPSMPAAPDPVATANAQGAANKETAYWNTVMGNANQYTPYGSIEYTDTSGGRYDPDFAPKFTSTIKLDPKQQAILDAQTGNELSLTNLGTSQLGRIGANVNKPFSFSGLPETFGGESQGNAISRAEEAIMSRMNPQFARDEEAMRTRLINQGIGQGSDAYSREMEAFNQAKNDARMQAILQGQQYGTNALNESLARRNQAIQEYTTERNAPLNEYTALTSGTQIQNPSFSNINAGQINPVDIAGLTNQAYQNQMAQRNAKAAGQQQLQSSLFGLGGAIGGGFAGSQAGGAALASLFASDIRLKEDINPVGEENGFKLYEFSYINDPLKKRYIGVMAHEIEEIKPEAVIEINGYKAVNYDMIGVKMREVA